MVGSIDRTTVPDVEDTVATFETDRTTGAFWRPSENYPLEKFNGMVCIPTQWTERCPMLE